MKKIRYYRIYGLNVKSEFPINYLDEFDESTIGEIDLEIFIGNIPKKFIEAYENNFDNVKLDGEEMCIEIEGLARYHMKNGTRLTIEIINKDRMEKIESFLLGRAFSILLYQRRTIVIHGSAIVDKDKERALIISGESGSGKSTLATEFLENGYKILADDIVALKVNYENEKIKALPAVGIQKICEDIIKKNKNNKWKIKKLDSSREKYCIDRRDVFISKGKRLKSLVILEKDSEINDIKIKRLKGIEKVMELFDNVFYSSYIEAVGIDENYLKDILYLSNNIEIYKIFRPEDKDTSLEQFSELLSMGVI